MEEKIKEVLKYEGVFSIVAAGDNFPHIANSWNSFTYYKDNQIFVPVGIMNKMQECLKKDNRVIVVIGTRDIEGLYGMGMGIKIFANAFIEDDTKEFEELKKRFEWARAIMRLEITDSYQTA